MSERVLMKFKDNERGQVWTNRLVAEKRLRKGEVKISLGDDPPDLADDPDKPLSLAEGDRILEQGGDPYGEE